MPLLCVKLFIATHESSDCHVCKIHIAGNTTWISVSRQPQKAEEEARFDAEPFRSEFLHLLAENPSCSMSSVYDFLVKKYVESGRCEILPGNENYICYLRGTRQAGQEEDRRRRYDVIETPDPGKKAQIDFGQVDCGNGLVVHFICILLWHLRLLGVYAQDHRYRSEEACHTIHRFTRKCKGRDRAGQCLHHQGGVRRGLQNRHVQGFPRRARHAPVGVQEGRS